MGFGCWYIVLHQHYQYRHIMIPISFDNIPDNMTLSAPELAEITVHGKRNDLCSLEHEGISFHIDAQALKIGKNNVSLYHEHLFLPEYISLLNCTPSTILVYMHEKPSQS